MCEIYFSPQFEKNTAFIIFLIAGFFVYAIIEVLLKDVNKVR